MAIADMLTLAAYLLRTPRHRRTPEERLLVVLLARWAREVGLSLTAPKPSATRAAG